MSKKLQLSKGQAIIESVLLMVVLLGLTIFIFNKIKDEGLISALIDSPKNYIKGMSQSGVWKKYPEDIAEHPNKGDRWLQIEGD